MNNNIWFVCCVSNPVGYFSRLKLYKDFVKHILEDLNVNLVTCECAFDDNVHVLKDEGCEYETENAKLHHIAVRAKSRMWHKENLLNIAISRIPDDVKYVCWCDADIEFLSGKDTVPLMIEALGKDPIIQGYSIALDTGPNGNIIETSQSFGKCYSNWMRWDYPTKNEKWFHSGYVWAARMDVIKAINGLYDVSIIGNGDYIMASAFVGKAKDCLTDTRYKDCTEEFKDSMLDFEKRVIKFTNGRVGYAPIVIKHGFHGYKVNRSYVLRDKIFCEHKYSPSFLAKNLDGVYEFVEGQENMQNDIVKYFESRKEDEDVVV